MNDYNNNQQNFWAGDFGDSYVQRNISVDDENQTYLQKTGSLMKMCLKLFFKILINKVKF